MALPEGLLSGLFGLGSGALNMGSTWLANKSNERMQREQNKHNLDMWNLNNQYNSPVSQMQRLEAAGMNPDLMYGNPSQGTSAAPAQGSNPIPKQAMFLDPMTLANLELAKSQKKNIDADTNQKEAQTEGISYSNIGLKADAEKSKLFIESFENMTSEERVDTVYNLTRSIVEGSSSALSQVKAGKQSSDSQYWRSIQEILAIRYGLSGDIFQVNHITGEIGINGNNDKVIKETDRAMRRLTENLEQAFRFGNKDYVDMQLELLAANVRATQNDVELKELEKEFNEWLVRGGAFTFELFNHKFTISPKQMLLFSDLFKTIFK